MAHIHHVHTEATEPLSHASSGPPLRREIFAAILLAMTTIVSAWCAYQASRWGGVQVNSLAQSSLARMQAMEKFTLAGQAHITDASIFSQYLKALDEGHDKLAEKMYRRFRPEAKIAVDKWLKLNPSENSDAPVTPFRMQEYRLQEREEASALAAQAEKKMQWAFEANENADNYILLTVIFASVLFFAGLAPKFTTPKVQTFMVAFGYLVFFSGVATALSFPVW